MNKKTILFYILILVLPLASFGKKRGKGEALTDSTQVIINQLFIGGNKKTKEKIILRELLFHKGDTVFKQYLDGFIEKSKENLLNTSLFNYVTINTIIEQPNLVSIYIIVEERWYLWPYLILEQADRNLSSFLHNKDWSRINYGLMVVKNNFRGRAETLKFKVRLGYKEQFMLGYDIPYIGNSRKHGLSAEFSWFRQNEIPYMIDFDELVFYKDDISYVSKKHGTRITYQYRKKHYLRHKFSAIYNYTQVNDTIIDLNSNYIGNSSNKTQYISLVYNFEIDKRNYKHYPLTGYNFEVILSKKGLNVLPYEIQGKWEIESLGYYYISFTDRLYGGLGARGKISSNYKQPFLIEEALGYQTSLRSFEYNVINGQQFVTGRTFLKYAIIPMQIRQIEGWGWSKFNKIHYSLYVNAFFDTGYVYDISPIETNTLPNSYLASAGIGVDLVAYYDQVIRFEYSINRFGNHGFFLHVGKAF